MDVFTASGGLAGSIFAAAAFLLSSYVENRYWSAIVRQTFVKEGIRLGAYQIEKFQFGPLGFKAHICKCYYRPLNKFRQKGIKRIEKNIDIVMLIRSQLLMMTLFKKHFKTKKEFKDLQKEGKFQIKRGIKSDTSESEPEWDDKSDLKTVVDQI